MSEPLLDFLRQPNLGRGWAENRAAILALRLTVVLVTSAALVFSDPGRTPLALAIVVFLLASHAWLAGQPAERFGDKRVQVGLAVGDLASITAAIELSNQARGEFLFAYFLVLLLVSLSGSFQRVAIVTTGASIAYAMVLWSIHDPDDAMNPSVWMQVPILFVTGCFFGLIAQASRDEHQALLSSEYERRALEAVLALTEKLDANTDVDAIAGTVAERLGAIVPRARLLRVLFQSDAAARPAQVLTISTPTSGREPDPGSLLSVPMMLHGEVAGAMVVSAEPPLAASEMHAARVIANAAAHALANAQIFQRERDALERFRQLDREHRRLLESAEDWIAVYRPDGTVMSWNRGAERISGIRASDAVGSRLERFFPSGSDPGWFLRLLAKGEVRTGVESLRLHADGSERLMMSTLSPFPSDGEPRILEIAKDVTEQRQLATRLDQAEKMSAMGNLISGVAHELNNPLTAVLLCARALERSPNAAPERLAILLSEAQRATRIVADLLAYARPAHEQHRPVDVPRAIENAVRAFQAALEARGPHVTVDIDDRLGGIEGSSREIEQALLNLLRNAAQAMSGQATASDGSIRVHAHPSPDGTWACLDVEDEGPGVPSSIRHRIFDPFFTTKAPGDGTGLGLSLVQRIMASHHGGVEIDDRLGGGAVFRLKFPVSRAAAVPFFPVDEREIPRA